MCGEDGKSAYAEVEDLNKGESGKGGVLSKFDSLIEHSRVRNCVVATPRVVIGSNCLCEKSKKKLHKKQMTH